MTAQSRIPHFCAMCGNPLIEAIPEGENAPGQFAPGAAIFIM